jgi:S1-C subfamily serine protease
MRWVSHLMTAAALVSLAPVSASSQTTPPKAEPPLSTEAIAARAVPATVTIVTFATDGDTLGIGSGFLVRSNGVIVTNHHVMAGASRATVMLSSGESYDRVEALDADRDADLAILRIPGYGLPTLQTTPTLPPVGSKLVAVGSPLGLARTVSEGIVSAVRLVDGRQLLQMSTAISPGSSGGPVLDARGRVVAIATKYIRDAQSLNFAVPVRYAMGLVENARAPVSLSAMFGTEDSDRDAASASDATLASAPERTKEPRRSVTGTYAVLEEVSATSGGRRASIEYVGLLLLGDNDLGLLAELPQQTTTKKETRRVSVSFVHSLTAPADGRVAIDVGGMTYTGYQTEQGLYLTANVTDSASRSSIGVALQAEPYEVDLTGASGLYEVSGRTLVDFTKQGTSRNTDWTGEAALVLANDSVYVDLFLTNSAGGTASFSAMGPIQGGAFDLSARSGARLIGTVYSARMVLDWTEPREWGSYRGRLDARRK